MNYIIRFKRKFPKYLKKEILEQADEGSEALETRKKEIQNLAYETDCWIKIKKIPRKSSPTAIKK